MYELEYYIRPNGAQPVAMWLDGLDIKIKASIMAKMDALQHEGLKLLGTNMMKPIKNAPGVYELIGGQCRVITYYESQLSKFVLVHGFLKKKKRETPEIKWGVGLVHEYLLQKEGI